MNFDSIYSTFLVYNRSCSSLSVLLQSILPESDVPAGQKQARLASTNVDFLGGLDILSRAARTRLSGIVCTIGPVSKSPEFLYDMIDAGMNIARMNFSHGSHEYHGDTMDNCRKAAEAYKKDKGFNPCLAIALDTKGPEIRTGLLEGVSAVENCFENIAPPTRSSLSG